MVDSQFTSPASKPIPVNIIEGSLNINNPIAVHGTVDIQSDVTIGTVEILNIIGGTLGRINDIAGTIEVSNIGNVAGTVESRDGGPSYAGVRAFLQVAGVVADPGTPIWTPVAGKSIRVTDLILSNVNAVNDIVVKLNGTEEVLNFNPNGQFYHQYRTPISGTPDGKLNIVNGLGTLNISARGYEL